MNTTKETYPAVTAEVIRDDYGVAIMLTQSETGTEDDPVVLLHPMQLRHIAERYAGVETAGWMNTQPVKTLTRRLRTLAFHANVLYDYLKNHSDHRHADLTWELSKATALSDMADEFCADLPVEDDADTQPAHQMPAPHASRKDASKAEQVPLI